jgi:hypothetical protein
MIVRAFLANLRSELTSETAVLGVARSRQSAMYTRLAYGFVQARKSGSARKNMIAT